MQFTPKCGIPLVQHHSPDYSIHRLLKDRLWECLLPSHWPCNISNKIPVEQVLEKQHFRVWLCGCDLTSHSSLHIEILIKLALMFLPGLLGSDSCFSGWDSLTCTARTLKPSSPQSLWHFVQMQPRNKEVCCGLTRHSFTCRSSFKRN